MKRLATRLAAALTAAMATLALADAPGTARAADTLPSRNKPATACSPMPGVCTATQVGTDDDVVWGLVTLPDGTILYSERDVQDIIHLDPKTGAAKSIGTVPNVEGTDGEGGTLGLEINPLSFSSDHWLYIMHTSPSDNRIVRIRYDQAADSMVTDSEQVLVTGIARNIHVTVG
ncbi:MAG: PQQ-dependent sugar dehydrogenase [Catenulisporales bacterium]|nr:PQQ-dependent sugar dehydrogenase [Catenulisporales bacterium]